MRNDFFHKCKLLGLKGIMARAEKVLIAAQKFLESLRALPHFAELRERQLDSVCQSCQQTEAFSTEASVRVLALLSREIWGQHGYERIQAIVASKTSDDLPGKASSRRSAQDYTMLPYYLSEELSLLLKDESVFVQVKVEMLARHAALLGLRAPSENTCAALCALACGANVPGKLTSAQQWERLSAWKPLIKKVLPRDAPPVYLLRLPRDIDDCPRELLVLTFGTETKAVPLEWDMAAFESVVKGWPLRKTNVLTQEATASGANSSLVPVQNQMMLMQAAQMQAMMLQRSWDQGATEPKPKEDLLVNLKLFNPPSASAPSATSIVPVKPLPLPAPAAVASPKEPLNSKKSTSVSETPASIDEEVKKLKSQLNLASRGEADKEEKANPGNEEKSKPKGKAKGKAKPKGKAKGSPKLAPKPKSVAKGGLKKRPSCKGPALEKEVEEEPLPSGNFSFQAAFWGDCKFESYSQKSYIRWCDHSDGDRMKMVVGSCGADHHNITRKMVPHVKRGLTREELRGIRDGL